jgi:hypothetical protein
MPLRYWRTLACLLALGIGGLAVCAEECIRGGTPAGRETRRAKAEPPAVAAAPSNAVALPPPADSKDAEPLILPMAPVTQPTIVIPAVHTPPVDPSTSSKPALSPPISTLPSLPTPDPLAKAVDLPPPPPMIAPKLDAVPTGSPMPLDIKPTPSLPPPPTIPVAPKFDPPPAPLPMAPIQTAPPALATPVTPPVPAIPAQPAGAAKPAAATGQYKLFLRMGGTGQPHFDIRDGDQLLLKVSCEQIELHGAHDAASGLPGLTATGKVKFHGSGLDGTCDQLTIVSMKGEVALKGGVRLTCYRGTTGSQVVAESVMFQLTRTGETATKLKAVGVGSIVPASLP